MAFWIVLLIFVFPYIMKFISKKIIDKKRGRIYINQDTFMKKIFKNLKQNKTHFSNSTKSNMEKIHLKFSKLPILFGKVKDAELSSGLHFVNPFEQVKKMSVRTEEYTMSIAHGEGQRKGSDQIVALTNEGLQLDLDITVFYKLEENKASDVYRELGSNYEEKIIRPEIRSAIRAVIARYNARAVYSEKRAEVAQEIRKHLKNTVEPRGIIIEQVLLRNVILPKGLASSIQKKLQAEQDAERLDFVLKKEKKEAERKRIEAQGQSDAQKIINETITPKYLQYLYIKNLKDRQGTIYVPTGSDGLPLIKSIQ